MIAQGEIPREAIEECTRGGRDAAFFVKKWVKTLGCDVPRAEAIAFLSQYAAWDDLDTVRNHILTERIFWLACHDIKESGEWMGLAQ